MSENAEASVDEEMGRSCKMSYFPRSEGGGKIHEKENNHEEMNLSPEFSEGNGYLCCGSGSDCLRWFVQLHQQFDGIRFGSCQRRNAQGRYVLPSVLSPT